MKKAQARQGSGFAASLMWKFGERCGFAVVQLAVQVVLARMLAPDDFGSLAVILAFVNVGTAIVQSGLNTALIQRSDTSEDDYSYVFWMSLALGVALSALLVVFSPLAARIFKMPQIEQPLRVMSAALVMSAFISPATARLVREMNFRAIFVTSIVAAVASGAAGILCAVSGLGLWSLVVQQVGYYVILVVTLAGAVSWRPRATFERGRAGELLSFGWGLLAANLIDTSYQSLADLAVGGQFDAEILGQMSQGKRWPQSLGYLLDGSIQPVALSALSRLQDDPAKVKALVRKTLLAYTFVTCACMAVVAASANAWVALLLGAQWLPCVPFVQLYCVTYAFLPIHTTNLQAIAAMGRADLVLRLELVKKSYGIALLAFAVLVLRNVYAIAATFVVSGLISTFVNALPNRKLFGYSALEQAADLLPSFALAVACAALGWSASLLGMGAMMTFALQVVVVLGAYVGAAHALGMPGLAYAIATAKSVLAGVRGAGSMK